MSVCRSPVRRALLQGGGPAGPALFGPPVAVSLDAVVCDSNLQGAGPGFAPDPGMVDLMGFEPTTSAMRVPRSPN